MRSSKTPRSASASPLANPAVITLTRVRQCTVSAFENVWGTNRRASEVGTSKGGISVTNLNRFGIGKRTARATSSTTVEAVNPPKVAGAALSGWPSSSVTN